MNSPGMASPVCLCHSSGRRSAAGCHWASRGWLRTITQEIPWQQPVIQVRPPPAVPRLTVFLADEGLRYRYSGTTHSGQGWPAWFEPLRNQVNEACGTSFNGCLLNLYRNGEDRMGWHADDEQEIDQTQPIAHCRWGHPRLRLRHRQDPVEGNPCPGGWRPAGHASRLPAAMDAWSTSRRRIKTSRVNRRFAVFCPEQSRNQQRSVNVHQWIDRPSTLSNPPRCGLGSMTKSVRMGDRGSDFRASDMQLMTTTETRISAFFDGTQHHSVFASVNTPINTAASSHGTSRGSK